MTVHVTELRHPRADEHGREPYLRSRSFETVYQLEGRLIGVGQRGGAAEGPTQLTRRHVVSVDFETLDLIPYSRMVDELPGDREAIPDDTVTVEKLR